MNGAMGEAVGEIYVKDHYPAESDRQMTELIGNLREAYQERISQNSWMDDATRKEALAKLAAFEPRIGHPVSYVDYSSLKVVKGDTLGNALRAKRHLDEAVQCYRSALGLRPKYPAALSR